MGVSVQRSCGTLSVKEVVGKDWLQGTLFGFSFVKLTNERVKRDSYYVSIKVRSMSLQSSAVCYLTVVLNVEKSWDQLFPTQSVSLTPSP